MTKVEFDFTVLEQEVQKLAAVVAQHNRDEPSHGTDCSCMDGITGPMRRLFTAAFKTRYGTMSQTERRGRLIVNRILTGWDY